MQRILSIELVLRVRLLRLRSVGSLGVEHLLLLLVVALLPSAVRDSVRSASLVALRRVLVRLRVPTVGVVDASSTSIHVRSISSLATLPVGSARVLAAVGSAAWLLVLLPVASPVSPRGGLVA